MSWLAKYFRTGMRNAAQGGTIVPAETILNFVSGATVADNPATGTTDVTITASPSTGQNPVPVNAGLNSNIPYANKPSVRLAGAEGPFSVGGFAPPSGTPGTGLPLDVIHTMIESMTIVDEDLASTPEYRIRTGTGAPITLPPRPTTVRLVYQGDISRWTVQGVGLAYPNSYNIRDFGAQIDGQTAFKGVMAASSSTLTTDSSDPPFTQADVNKLVVVQYAGTTGANGYPGIGTITGYTNPHQVTVSFTASQATQAAAVNITTTSGNAHKTISSSTPGKPTTFNVPSHGYETGDTVLILGTGLPQVDGFQPVVTVVDANNFIINTRTTTACSGGTCQSLTMHVFTASPHNLVTGMYPKFTGPLSIYVGYQVQVVDATEFAIYGISLTAAVTTGTVQSAGTRVDWGSDDLEAWQTALATAAASGSYAATVRAPAGLSLISSAFVVDDSAGASGIRIQGAGPGGPDASNYTRLALAGSSYACIDWKSTNSRLEDLWIDGNKIPHVTASSAALFCQYFTSNCIWERLLISGGADGTGNEVNFGPDFALNEVDNIIARRINIFHDPYYRGSPAKSLSNIRLFGNSQAGQITFERLNTYDGAYGALITAGSINIIDAQMFSNSVAIIAYEAVQWSKFYSIYTERNSGVPFLLEMNGGAVNGAQTVLVEQCIMQDNCEIRTGCKQPLLIVGHRSCADIVIVPATPPGGDPNPIGVFHVADYGTVFAEGFAFTGDLTHLDQFSTQAPTSVDGTHGYYDAVSVGNRMSDLIAQGTLNVVGGEVQHITEIETIAYLALIDFGGSAQLIDDFDATKGVTVDGSTNVVSWLSQASTVPLHTLAQATPGDRPPYVGGNEVNFPWPGSYNTQRLQGALAGTGIASPFEFFFLVEQADANAFQLIDLDGSGTGIHTGGAGIELHGSSLFTGAAFSIGAMHVLDAIFKSGTNNAVISVDGAADVHGTVGTSNLGTTSTLGNIAAGGGNWTGPVKRMLVLNQDVSATYRHQIQAQLAWLGGVTFLGSATQVAYPCDSMTDDFGNIIKDRRIVARCASGLAATLPAPTVGRVITFADYTGIASTTASITVLPHGSEKINGTTSYTMSTNYGSVTLSSPDGVNWIASAGG